MSLSAQKQRAVAACGAGADAGADGASLVAACRDGIETEQLAELKMLLASGPRLPSASGPVDGSISMLRHLQMQTRRLDQWLSPKGVSGQSTSDSAELLSLARLVLELITAATPQVHQSSQDDSSGSVADSNQSQSQKEKQAQTDKEKQRSVKAACLAVRKKLDCFTVAFAVRESVSSLLYVAVMAESKQAGQLVEGGKGQLAEIVYQICGLRDNGLPRQPSCASSQRKEPCAECKCCHIAIQEALSLLQFLHKSLWQDPSAQVLEQTLSKHVEDGIVLLLQILIQLSSQLHETCYLAAHRASSQFGWRPLYEEIRQRCTLVSWPHMYAWSSFERSLHLMELSFSKLERRVPARISRLSVLSSNAAEGGVLAESAYTLQLRLPVFPVACRF
eukprot:Skav234142  [mRNA]  locus=scaffold361:118289:122859:- [translate_table: standard]